MSDHIQKILYTGLLAIILSGCANYEYHATKTVDAKKVDTVSYQEMSEDAFLDVGIQVFDTGLELLDEESAAYTNVRQSEAVWFSSQLKQTLEKSKAWGAVRAMPRQNAVMDLMIQGQIIESNGETVKLNVTAIDASGRQWLAKEYSQRASAYAYHPDFKQSSDPFQSVFNEIANDLFDKRSELTETELGKIRQISNMRFASELAPDMFGEFVEQSDNGLYALKYLPADGDPMIQRVDRIKARNQLFLDVVQDYYRAFNKNMAAPYNQWRQQSYREVVYERQLKSQATKEKWAGAAMILAGVLAQGSNSRTNRVGGHVGIIAGADLFRSGFSKADEAILHTETLRELGESLELELEPSIIDLQDRSFTLSGTVDQQFKEWRRILSEMIRVEQGLPVDEETTAQVGLSLEEAATISEAD